MINPHNDGERSSCATPVLQIFAPIFLNYFIDPMKESEDIEPALSVTLGFVQL